MKVRVGKHLYPIDAEIWVRKAHGSAKKDAEKNGGFAIYVFPDSDEECVSCGHLVMIEQGGNRFRDKNGTIIEAKRKWTNEELDSICKKYEENGSVDKCPLCANDIYDHNLENRWETNWAICGNPKCPLESQSFIINAEENGNFTIELPYYLYEKDKI